MHCYTNPTQIRNRCILGGKGRGIFSDFKMSRVSIQPRNQPREGGGTPKIGDVFADAMGTHSITSGSRPSRALCLVCRRLVGRRKGRRGMERLAEALGKRRWSCCDLDSFVKFVRDVAMTSKLFMHSVWMGSGRHCLMGRRERRPMAARDGLALYINTLQAEEKPQGTKYQKTNSQSKSIFRQSLLCRFG